jgi:hypothetical protein
MRPVTRTARARKKANYRLHHKHPEHVQRVNPDHPAGAEEVGPEPGWQGGVTLTLMVEGWCHRCGKPLGKVAWDAADFTWHRKCAKADEVYTPPPQYQRGSRAGA